MLINLNDIKVKGMERGAVYTSGDWYIVPEENVHGGNGFQVKLPELDASGANLFMQAITGPVLGASNLVSAGFPGYRGAAHSAGITSFWASQMEGTLDGFFEKLNGSIYDMALLGGVCPTDVDGTLSKLMEYSQLLAEKVGFKPHPKAAKAMQGYLQDIREQVMNDAEARDWLKSEERPVTPLNLLVYRTYRSNRTRTGWGTYIDDVVNIRTGEVAKDWADESGLRRLMWAGKDLIKDFMNLHLYYSNSQFWPVGYGFQGGNPVLVLAKFNPDMSVRTQVVRVGRYFSSLDGLIDVRDSINDLKMLNQQMQTHLCKTEREWHYAYNGGIQSCMSGFHWDDSPVRVYATESHGLPDNSLRLFISYVGELFGDDFKVVARAIVNIDTQRYVRAYGQNADAVLRAAGYTHDTSCTDGCILARIQNSDGYCLMPYQDGDADRVDDEGDRFILGSRGSFDACQACGYLEELYMVDCDRCCDSVSEDEIVHVEVEEGYDVPWCAGCASNHATYVRRRGLVSDELLAEEAEAEADEDEDEEAA